MQTPFFHPSVVHVPMALGVLMPIVAGGIALAWWRGWLPARAWALVVFLQLVLLGSGVVALRTGEAEEDRVERVVAESAIETHEEAAEAFVGASGVVLLVMVLAAALGERRSGRGAAAAAALGTLVVVGLGVRTGQAGGSLVYEHGAAAAYVGAAPAGASDGAAPAGGLDARRDDDD